MLTVEEVVIGIIIFFVAKEAIPHTFYLIVTMRDAEPSEKITAATCFLILVSSTTFLMINTCQVLFSNDYNLYLIFIFIVVAWFLAAFIGVQVLFPFLILVNILGRYL